MKKILFVLAFFFLCQVCAFAQSVEIWKCKVIYQDDMYINGELNFNPAKKEEYEEFVFYYDKSSKKVYKDAKNVLETHIIGENIRFTFVKSESKKLDWFFVVDRTSKNVKMTTVWELNSPLGRVVYKRTGTGVVEISNGSI